MTAPLRVSISSSEMGPYSLGLLCGCWETRMCRCTVPGSPMITAILGTSAAAIADAHGLLASRLSPILRSFPRATGLSAPRTRGRIGTETGEKRHRLKSTLPGCVCPHPQLFAGFQGFQNMLLCSGHCPVTRSLSRSPGGPEDPWAGAHSPEDREAHRTGRLLLRSGSRSLWAHGVKLLPFPGLRGRVQSQGPPAPPSLWQPCVCGE